MSQRHLKEIKRILVTGGSGFLGKALLKELFEPDSPIKSEKVRVLDIEDVPDQFKSRVEFISGDVRDYNAVLRACKDVSLVIHAAAVVDWGVRSKEEVLAVNVGGTENVVKACLEANVPYLLHTSSLDAVYSGQPLVDIDESQPYPEAFKTTYCKSKYLSEVMVTEAHSEALKTCSLRPSDIYGEMDPYHIDALIDQAKKGFYIRLGNGKSKCQHIYVGNMAIAMLQAATALMDKNSIVGGQVYFITDAPGSNFFKFFDQIVIGAGYPIRPKNLWLPRGFAFSLGALSEVTASLIRPFFKNYYTKFSRFAVQYTCTDFTFSSAKAQEDFGFKPKYSKEEALRLTIDFYRQQREMEKK